MSKNIVICCDGTNNKLAGDHTNVVRLFDVAVKSPGQMAFYDPGVGTLAAPDQTTRLGRGWSLAEGLAFGAGFDENVFDAYRYLMASYQDGDKVYLFGFSRGAFTVRVLAGMLHGVGLLHAGTDNLLRYSWESYRQIPILGRDTDEKARAAAAAARSGIDELLKNFTRPCPVEFMGLWDTVGSVGMYNWNQAYPFSFSNPGVACVRHAVSLDERRAGFRSNVYKDDGATLADGRPKVMNVWFPGVHSDVGGGYPVSQSGLAMVCFQWIVEQAKLAGMEVDDARVQGWLAGCRPDALGPNHDELAKAGWKAMEYLPARRYNWTTGKTEWRYKPNKPREAGVTKAYLHQGVIDRIKGRQGYWPAALPQMDVDAIPGRYTVVPWSGPPPSPPPTVP